MYLNYGFTCVIDALILGVEGGFLQHSQENDTANPELDAQQISPLQERQRQPNQTEDHVEPAHEPVEREQRPVWRRQVAVSVAKVEVHAHGEVGRVGVGRHSEDVNAVMLRHVDGMSAGMQRLLVCGKVGAV